ncbi:hypothetical protein GCM10007216_03260 [Thalassobacillus devorans]|uniref:Uncharacterized protein n=1 Tax=Thalassobacillus devorans TaxID=279813 RepID=A0ABQ1NFX6_9BACI|nr:hypothetical protein [Thalassobacillus devorans]NIK27234.1 hypothetical protein [Thalassobacillus devorans]GGC76049.1 hypothetical protein GCM10007216_03260 [Thalassobacillus devorans]
MEMLVSEGSQIAIAALLGAFHGLNPAMGWLFAVFLAVQKDDWRVLIYAIIPIGMGQMLGDGAVVLLQTIARFQFPLHIVHLSIASIVLGYGIYRLFRYFRHVKWTGGLKVGYGQLLLWSFLAASTHGSGLLLSPFILGADSIADILPLYLFHELAMLTSMTVVAFIVYHIGMMKIRKYIVNFDLIWAVLLIVVGLILFLMNVNMGGEMPGHMH